MRPHDEVVLNTMWALDDFTATNGATEILPGSHLWGGETPDEFDSRIRTIEMSAGLSAPGLCPARLDWYRLWCPFSPR